MAHCRMQCIVYDVNDNQVMSDLEHIGLATYTSTSRPPLLKMSGNITLPLSLFSDTTMVFNILTDRNTAISDKLNICMLC